MKLLIVADIHVKLGQRKVPKEWQINRLNLLADEINKHKVDLVVIAGDLFDTAKPSVEEVGATLNFLQKIIDKKLILPGNHEMVNKKTDCFAPLDNILGTLLDTEVVRTFDQHTIPNVDIIPYNVLFQDFPDTTNRLAITHVRGSIPPHVEPEIDLERLSHYSKVFAGDLHSYTCSQLNILYPGSPFATSFHRSKQNKGNTGIFILDTVSEEHEWVQLDLPELLRLKASSTEEMVADPVNNVIYELEGELEDLAKVKDSDLLDKKVANNIYKEASLALEKDTPLEDEVFMFLKDIRNMPEDQIKRVIDLLAALKVS